MENELVRIALTRQHGVISRQQAFEMGMSRGQVSRRLKTGQWQRRHYGVYQHTLMSRGLRSRAMVAAMGSGGVVSHRLAAWLHRFEELQRVPVEVTVTHGHSRLVEGVIVHQSTQIDRVDRMDIDAIPCTGLARTALDLGAVQTRQRHGAVLDALLRTRRLTQADLWDVLIRHSRQGRDGCGRLRERLEERFGAGAIPLSDWSRMVSRLLVAQGFPEPQLEFGVHDDHGRFLAQVDLAYPTARLAVELDSVGFHFNLPSFQRDRSRLRLLAVEGWTVLPFTWADYRERPHELIAQVRKILMAQKHA